MSIKITEECVACDACVPECPNEAISEGDVYVIDPDKCTECVGFHDAPMCAEVCPVDNCCIPDENHPESVEQLLEKARKLHPDKEPDPTKVWSGVRG
jgi:ferredoxin